MRRVLAMAVAVLDKIVRKCHDTERAYHQGPLSETNYSMHGNNWCLHGTAVAL